MRVETAVVSLAACMYLGIVLTQRKNAFVCLGVCGKSLFAGSQQHQAQNVVDDLIIRRHQFLVCVTCACF